MGKESALEGIKVLEFAYFYTAPIAARFLGDCGADVIKVESFARPDECRMITPFKDGIAGMNRSGLFANYNANKYGMSLNLRHREAKRLIERLAAWADVFIDGYRPGVMAQLGLSYEEVKKANHDIIYVSVTTQGQTGPFSRQPTVGAFFQAATGTTHFTGWPDREFVGTPTPYPDFIAPWYVLVAILAALDYRRRTCDGIYIDANLLESSLHFIAPALLDYTANGRVQKCRGNHSSYAAPHGAYRCKGDDRWCAVAVFNDQEWQAFCDVVGNREWTRDTKFATMLGRKANEDELERLVEEWTTRYSAQEVMTMMQAAGVAAGIVQNGEDLVDRDPQLKYRQHLSELHHPEIGSHFCEMAPFRLSETPGGLKKPAPCLGEHNEFICREILGMTDKEFIELMAVGVFD